jgi:hypothetical protein
MPIQIERLIRRLRSRQREFSAAACQYPDTGVLLYVWPKGYDGSHPQPDIYHDFESQVGPFIFQAGSREAARSRQPSAAGRPELPRAIGRDCFFCESDEGQIRGAVLFAPKGKKGTAGALRFLELAALAWKDIEEEVLPDDLRRHIGRTRDLLHPFLRRGALRWLLLVYSLAWDGHATVPITAERRTWWHHPIDLPWNAGAEPRELSRFMVTSRYRMDCIEPLELPDNWLHFYSELNPGPLQASAEVLGWIAERLEVQTNFASASSGALTARPKSHDVETVLIAKPQARVETVTQEPTGSSTAAEALDGPDLSLLAFLNRTPLQRRKISDVLPDDGPQDRKAVAKRLRRLAERTPPLVDFPKTRRSGVAILQAGVEALKQACPSTPH